MEMFAVLGIYIGICMMLVAIFVLGPTRSHRDGILGKAHRLLSSIPALIGTCCCLMCTRGRMGKAQENWHSCSEATTSKKNPALVVFYIVLVWGVNGAFLYFVVPEMSSLFRKFVSTFFIVLSEYCYIAACRADPGVVSGCQLPPPPETEESVVTESSAANSNSATPTLDLLNRRVKEGAKKKAAFQVAKSPLPEDVEYLRNNRYSYDGVLYSLLTTTTQQKQQQGGNNNNNNNENNSSHKGKKGKNKGGSSKPGGGGGGDTVDIVSVPECYTCNMPRPARSKHCSMCDQCVRRYDHHCPWINNDVGEGNLRHFMAFLITHVLTCFFCGTECLLNVLKFVEDAKIWRSMFVGVDGKRSHPSTGLVLMYTISHKTVVCCVVLFAYVIGLMLLWFWGHHMWLAMKNITTNEEGKIDMIMDYIGSIRNFVNFEEDIKYTIYAPPTPDRVAAAKKAGAPPPTASKAEFDEKLERRRLTAQQQLERTKPSFLSEYVAAQIYVFYTDYEKKIRGEALAQARKKIQDKKIVLGPYESPMKHVNNKALVKARRIPEGKFKKALVKTYDCGSKWMNLKESLFPHTPSGVHSKTPSETHSKRARLVSITPSPLAAPPSQDSDITATIRKRIATVDGSGSYVGWGGTNLVSFATGTLQSK